MPTSREDLKNRALADDPQAQYEVGKWCENIKEYTKAVHWFTKSANQNYKKAKEDLVRITNAEKEWQRAWECFKQGNAVEAAKQFEKIMRQENHHQNIQAMKQLANLHESAGLPYKIKVIPNANIEEAIRLHEKVVAFWKSIKSKSGMPSRLHLGMLYCEGNENNTPYKPNEGAKLIIDALTQLEAEDGDDSYLDCFECHRLGWIYYKGMMTNGVINDNDVEKALEFWEKASARCSIGGECKEFHEKLAKHAQKHLNSGNLQEYDKTINQIEQLIKEINKTK
ncbi:MAG: hypothetical protein FWH24_00075 [Oscillospiraceae bacterium]|nr:hypothetical protein [Oscillospiraceae bacterium]